MTESNKLLPDEVYEDLLEKILKHEWQIGDRIPSESKLCETYGISRVSARTAIQKLQAQNLVVTKTGRGTFVTANQIGENIISQSIDKMDLSKNEFRYVVELRKAIEFTSIDLMVKYGKEADFEQLRSALEEMKNCAGDTKVYVEADYKFHMALVNGSHNPLFSSVMNGCKDAVIKYFTEMALISNGDFQQPIENHEKIYNAMVSKKPDEVKKIIEGTFEYNISRFRYAFKGENNEDH